ncbi:MAG: biotin--[acetyl-CoA-carboxylase] ligase [Aminobacterium sp.]|nr:biotin--[acetyl-CoA-carboxylase] ligase [Aminobacterium sp.]
MKKHILTLLKQAQGNYVSGQDLCEHLGVSRTAVWKHINQLREEGYAIDSSARKGYRLIDVPDLLNEYEVEPLLTTENIGHPIIHLDEVTSTNIEAKKQAREGIKEGTVIVAEHQTEGRGRSGRSWFSSPEWAIQMSLVLRPKVSPAFAASITQVGAAAVAKALESLGLSPQIKWPNDVLIGGKKICGILTEMSCELDHISHIVIGIGINVNTPSFPEEIASVATSVRIELGGEHCNRKELMAAVLNAFEPLYIDFLKGGSQPEYLSICRHLSNLMGQFITYETSQGIRSAQAVDIDNMGRLIIRHEDETTEALLSGEVHILRS